MICANSENVWPSSGVAGNNVQGRIWRWEPTKIRAATRVGCRIDLLRLAKVGVPTGKEFGRRTGAVAAIAISLSVDDMSDQRPAFPFQIARDGSYLESPLNL